MFATCPSATALMAVIRKSRAAMSCRPVGTFSVPAVAHVAPLSSDTRRVSQVDGPGGLAGQARS
ncbi:hypothetical protein FHR32_002096 [Streptosporangium album]|uniref:Uncharacterized protein n=1 Tax=Streptosporangium album TaxID=47479 RepID=A0A7W7RTA9_9ACTN|nr:hypothetical protein [Streptosporangium album]